MQRFAKNPIWGLGMLVLLASFPAAAQQGGKRMAPPAGPSGYAAPKQVPASDTGPQNRDAHLEGRMTPEQRQQLRRDVHKHGRDIYHQRSGPKQP